MNGTSATSSQIKNLKERLEAAIESKQVIEEDLAEQAAFYTQFISKLSQTCKGIDKELDNKLANLRSLLNKPYSKNDIEKLAKQISQLLQNHEVKNTKQLADLHSNFHDAGVGLQKINGLPDKTRRDLRKLLKDNTDSKEAVVQYTPLLTQLLEHYQVALKSKSGGPLLNEPLIKPLKKKSSALTKPEATINDLIKSLSKTLTALELTGERNRTLSQVKRTINVDMCVEDVIQALEQVFSLIIAEFEQERESAKTFLSTLSKTLLTVQSAVKTTIATNQSSRKQHEQLNAQLKEHIAEITGVTVSEISVDELKNVIKVQLQKIASTIEEKTALEQKQAESIDEQLEAMNNKVSVLEEQGRVFKKRLEEQQIKSMQDALTKLGNRAAFDQCFAKELVRYHHSPFELAIVVMDLDNFKRINDTYGHTAGDKTLQVIANTLSKQLDKDVFIGRYGGEEFVLVYSGINKKNLVTKLNQVKDYVARLPFKFKDTKVSITLSVGVTHVNESDNVHTAFERADQALYQAKNKGKNQVVYID